MGPGFKSRRSANFQRLCRTFEIGIYMRHRRPSVNGELRENVTLVARYIHCLWSSICKSGAISNDQRGNIVKSWEPTRDQDLKPAPLPLDAINLSNINVKVEVQNYFREQIQIYCKLKSRHPCIIYNNIQKYLFKIKSYTCNQTRNPILRRYCALFLIRRMCPAMRPSYL